MLKKALTLLLLFSAPIFAQETRPAKDLDAKVVAESEADPDSEDGSTWNRDSEFITLRAGLDMTSQYFFRGILQENQGVVGQPWAELQLHFYRSESLISDVYLFSRSWNSFHSGPSGTESKLSHSPAAWYETQLTVGLGIEAFDVFTVSGGYSIQISPNDRFTTVEELFLRGDLDDKKLWNLRGELGSLKWEFNGLQLYGMFAWETDGQRDGVDNGGKFTGINRGVYSEVGAKPGVTLRPCDAFTISLSVPISVGFNVFEYHEVPHKGDAPFGFFTLGFEGEVPLKAIPERFGAVSLYGAVNWYNLGQNVSKFNNGHNDEVVVSGGMRFSY
jgi:hypothetical protein